MGDGRASLPMYDWPEVEWAVDRLWACIRAALADQGIAAPESLQRREDPMALWRAEDLVLSQTCGLIFAEALAETVAIVGAFDMGLTGCAPGSYRSVIVGRKGAHWPELAEVGRPACNDPMSQSGYRVLAGMSARRDEALMTGAHRASILAVADGRADFAAIDMASWRLAEAHEPATRDLDVLALTPPTPGLPLITRQGCDIVGLRRAIAAGVAGASEDVRDATGVRGFVARDAAAYLGAYAGRA